MLEKIAEAARCGVDFVQLREKDLSTRELEALAGAAVRAIREISAKSRSKGTRLLINSRSDVALACGADGVHLRADDVSPSVVRGVWNQCGQEPIVSVSCHCSEEVVRAAAERADFALFGPVFEKRDQPGTKSTGVGELQDACGHGIRVLAIGGVTLENAASCIRAGASGIAAIRLFQENDMAKIAASLGGIS